MGDRFLRFAELIEDLPLSSLKNLAQSLSNATGLKIIRNLRDAGAYEKKQELLSGLLAFFEHPPNLSRLWLGLTEDEKTALKTIYYGSGPAGLSVGMLHPPLNRLLGNSQRSQEALRGLTRYYLIYQTREQWQHFYLVTDEVISLLYGQTVAELKAEGIPAGKVEALENQEDALLSDLYTLLAATLSQDISVTAASRLFRRAQKKIRATFSPYDTEERYDLLEKMAWDMGLLENKDGKAALTEQAWKWVKEPKEVQWKGALQWAFQDFNQGTPHLFFYYCHNLLGNFPPENFLPLPALVKTLAQYRSPTEEQTILKELNSYADLLLWLGCLENGQRAGQRVARLSPTGRCLITKQGKFEDTPRAENFVLQPNFEIIASRELATGLLWQLHLCADLVQADRMFIFRLTRASFYRAFQAGRKPGEILNFLKQHSKYDLPQNVLFSLREWQREIGRVNLVQAALLRCDGPELAAEIKASRRLGPFIVGEITAQDLLVPSEAAQKVLTLLQQEGYLPLPKIITPTMRER